MVGQRLFAGVAALKKRGEGAERLERDARIKAAALLDSLLPGQTFRTQRWTLEDGSRLDVSVWRDNLGERAHIKLFSPGEQMEPLLYFFESGLLKWDALTPYHPYRVYIGDRLRRFDLPPLATPDYYLSRGWVAANQTIYADYPDFASDLYVDRNFWPSFWTGRARLLVQAFHAIRRDPREIFGSEPNAARQGIWKAGGRYFVVSIAPAGMTIQALGYPENPPLYARIARAKLLEGIDDLTEATMAEAAVLSVLQLQGDAATVLDAGTLAPVYAAGAPVAYGWKLARSATKASVVTFREECMPEFAHITCIGQFVTQLFTVDATYDETTGSWSATLLSPKGPTRSRPRPGWTSFYRPQYGANYQWNYIGLVPGWGESIQPAGYYGPIGDTVQAVYCWYDTEDKLQIVWYIQHQERTQSIDTRGSEFGRCGPPYERAGRYGQIGTMQGGFAVSEAEPALSDFIDGYYQYTDETYKVKIETTGNAVTLTVRPTGSDVDFYNAATMFCSGGEESAWYEAHSPYIPGNPLPTVGKVVMTAQAGAQHEALDMQYFEEKPRVWSCVIAAFDAEAAYVLVKGGEKVVGAKRRAVFDGSTTPDNRLFFGGSLTFAYYNNTETAVLRESTLSDLKKTVSPGHYDYGAWAGMVVNIVNRDQATSLSPETVESEPPRFALYSPHGAQALPENSSWSSFFPESVLEGTFIQGQPILACFSYTGDGLYSEGEGQHRMRGGYAAQPGTQGLFIGGA